MAHRKAAAIVMVRTLHGTPAQVFAAWTDPQQIVRWLAPSPCKVAEAEIDARVGGRYRITVIDPNGQTHITSGEYREVVPAERLVKTWIYEGPPRSESVLTVELHEVRSGVTELTVRHDYLDKPEDRAKVGAGWVLCLDNLDNLFSGNTAQP
jgi:uncharacterized protein YndB with AHSA1/START domain